MDGAVWLQLLCEIVACHAARHYPHRRAAAAKSRDLGSRVRTKKIGDGHVLAGSTDALARGARAGVRVSQGIRPRRSPPPMFEDVTVSD